MFVPGQELQSGAQGTKLFKYDTRSGINYYSEILHNFGHALSDFQQKNPVEPSYLSPWENWHFFG